MSFLGFSQEYPGLPIEQISLQSIVPRKIFTYRSDHTSLSSGTEVFEGRALALYSSVRTRRKKKNQWQRTDDTRSEIPVSPDDLDEIVVRELSGTIGINEDRQRLRNNNRVRQLDQATACKTASNKRLG